ncbi:MAG: M1 family metallopeptidase [Proteobacteria bacterium]|nr:M1 family metallopeptidase [Pseudomonadota bacterium]
MMSIVPRLFLASCFALAGASALAATMDSPPLEKLPRWAVPESYALDLRIDPAQSGFSGTATIRLKLTQPSDHVWLHGKDLAQVKVSVTDAHGKVHAARYVDAAPKPGVVRVDFGSTLAAQELTLRFDYHAPYNGHLEGLYKVVYAGKPYVMTQMEPISARYAFPGFDEPDFKTPFDISITAPEDLVAVANTAALRTTAAGKGWKKVTFTQTLPLPTYLVAYAVGPWDIKVAPDIAPSAWRKHPLPLRGIAAAGQAQRMAHVLGQTPVIIQTLEDYYGFGYPFDKLDLAAMPDFSAGAMENAGLVTFRDWLLLLDADSAQSYVQGSFNVTAHELAHQWTGDTVTMGWWNDLWLNESFATWMQKKITEKVHPEYRADLDRVEAAQHAMANDSLVSARKIRQPITGNGDIQTAFDGITYSKGAAVLAMFEGFVGDKTFQDGMRAYIAGHKFGNASADDLIDAITKAADKGIRFKQAFGSFLDQSGVPMVRTQLDCSGKQPTLKLAQSRYLPLGSTGDVARTWGVPMCVRTPAGTRCELFDSATGSMTLEDKSCPAWYMPNAGARGYYRFSMAPQDLAQLTAALDTLNDAEKLAYADAIDAAFRHGDIDAHDVLAALRKLAPSATAQVSLSPLSTFDWIWHREAITDAQKARLREVAKAAYLPRMEALGYTRRASDTPQDIEMRGSLASTLGHTLKIPEVRAALLAQGDAVLKKTADGQLDFAAANPDLIGSALAVAVAERGKPAVDELIAALPVTTDPAQRNAILGGLGGAPAGQADRVRDFAIGKDVKVGEMGRLLGVDRDTREGRTAMWNWFVKHFDQILARTGTFASGYLPGMAGGGGCSQAEAERMTQFFTPRLKDLSGADRGLAQATESTLLCAALKAKQDPAAILK